MSLLTMENPTFVAYAAAAALMVLKLMVQGWATVALMIRTDAGLLNPERAARIVEFHARDAKQLQLRDVINAIGRAVRGDMSRESTTALAQRAAQSVFVMRLMDLGVNENASSDVRSIAQRAVAGLPMMLFPEGQATPEWVAHKVAVQRDVERYAQRPYSPYTPQKPLATPAGDPI